MTNIPDTPMHRVLFIELTQAQQDEFLNQLRMRRLTSVRKHEELNILKQKAADDKLRKLIDTQSRQMEKEITAATKALDKVELRYNKIAALRLMIESEAAEEQEDTDGHEQG